MRLQRTQPTQTPISDQAIVDLYWARDERAIRETDLKYGTYLFSIAYNIVHDRLDCEECLNDTYMGAWNAMPPTRPRVLQAFLLTIMRRIAINRYRRNLRKSAVPSELTVSFSELEPFIADNERTDAAFEAKQLGAIISNFVRSLPKRKQYIFMSRYYAAEPIETIARDLDLSRSTIQKELAAIRSALKETLEKEGYSP